MGVDGIGGLVVDGRDQLGSTGRKGIGLMVENAMNDAAVGHLFGIRANRVCIERERPPGGLGGTAQDIPNALVNRNLGLVLLMVLDNRSA